MPPTQRSQGSAGGDARMLAIDTPEVLGRPGVLRAGGARYTHRPSGSGTPDPDGTAPRVLALSLSCELVEAESRPSESFRDAIEEAGWQAAPSRRLASSTTASGTTRASAKCAADTHLRCVRAQTLSVDPATGRGVLGDALAILRLRLGLALGMAAPALVRDVALVSAVPGAVLRAVPVVSRLAQAPFVPAHLLSHTQVL
jgi:hypothetical protein